MSVNKVILMGHLGDTPKVNSNVGNTSVANFSLATNEKWTDKQGQKQERTEWHRIVVWGALATICGEYLSKGSQVYLEGKIETRKWQDKEGATRYTTEVKANNIQFIGSVGETQADQSQPVEQPMGF